MRLTVIGCAGSFPGPGRAASCYLVEAEGFRLVVDLGCGGFGPLPSMMTFSGVSRPIVPRSLGTGRSQKCGRADAITKD